MRTASARVGFAGDVAFAAAALMRQPSVLLVSLLVGVSWPETGTVRGLYDLALTVLGLACFIFSLGWFGAERIFFQRQLEGNPVSIVHLVRLVKPFIGRYAVLGALFGFTVLAFFFVSASVFHVDLFGDGTPTFPFPFQIAFFAFAIVMDFALTFVTPALAYSTRSVSRALDVGLGLIGRTWPRSALYVLCPPLAIQIVNDVFPVARPVPRLLVTTTVVVVGLVAKGAIAAFYLRELGTYSDDGAAYITSRREGASERPSEAMV